jgi:hypothetical protein
MFHFTQFVIMEETFTQKEILEENFILYFDITYSTMLLSHYSEEKCLIVLEEKMEKKCIYKKEEYKIFFFQRLITINILKS